MAKSLVNSMLLCSIGGLLTAVSWHDFKTCEIQVSMLMGLLGLVLSGLALNIFQTDWPTVMCVSFIAITAFWSCQTTINKWVGEGDMFLFAILALTGTAQQSVTFAYFITLIGGILGVGYSVFSPQSSRVHIPFAPVICLGWGVSRYVSLDRVLKVLTYVF